MDRTILNPLPTVDVVSSIREHLSRLLNARQGSLKHLPDYGLPDLGEIYQKIPESLQQLKQAILNLISRYEPRLRNSKITFQSIENIDCVICLTIYSTICNGEKIHFDVNFLSGGIVFLF
ncbi:MAG TPA: type VI secretion system baseplate subunit TssE [Gammaproteobacteria bacterium]|nr:type VI secretion system baseplate subunit TssE [Gammaproteobacteria bacterium]